MQHKNLDMLKILLASDANMLTTNKKLWSPLVTAAKIGLQQYNFFPSSHNNSKSLYIGLFINNCVA